MRSRERMFNGLCTLIGTSFVSAMSVTPSAVAARLRTVGLIWIVLAPVLFLLAAVSTVRSDQTYNIQLAAFSLVAVAGIVFGTAAVLRRSWSATGLFVLSCLGATYFFGAAISTLVWPALAGPIWRVAMALMIAAPAMPFLLMARRLRHLVKTMRGETAASAA